jgi:hypothetical protein
MKHIYVNGPINSVRLEGTVNNIHKVIYLFMDYHIKPNHETKCSDIYAIDIDNYLVKTFSEMNDTKKKYDLFVEIYPTDLFEENDNYRNRYIDKVAYVFKNIFKFDTAKNIIRENSSFKNLRLHYFDIRDYFFEDIYNNTMNIERLAKNLLVSTMSNTDLIYNIIELLGDVRDHVQYILDIINDDNKNTKTKIIQDKAVTNVQTLQYLINKIKSKYNHTSTKKLMNDLLKEISDNFKKLINNIDTKMKKFITILNKFNNSEERLVNDDGTYSYGYSDYTLTNTATTIYNDVIHIFNDQFLEYFSRFTDIFFLRRFIDKDYITNCIIYAGERHCTFDIDFLVKRMGFKITHTSYNKYNDFKKLNTKVKSSSDISLYLLPPYLIQCSDLTSFPKNFD